nr:hypothetical protein Iba_chr11eCG11440 [Ipomoea batatas]
MNKLMERMEDAEWDLQVGDKGNCVNTQQNTANAQDQGQQIGSGIGHLLGGGRPRASLLTAQLQGGAMTTQESPKHFFRAARGSQHQTGNSSAGQILQQTAFGIKKKSLFLGNESKTKSSSNSSGAVEITGLNPL